MDIEGQGQAPHNATSWYARACPPSPNAKTRLWDRGNLTVEVTSSDWVSFATSLVAQCLKEQTSYGRASLCLSGGSTPLPVYEALGRTRSIAWNRVHLYFADERCVPRSHQESNYRKVCETVLLGIPVALQPRIWGVPVERGPQKASELYSAVLPERLDLLLLGLGCDGHMASLFPSCHSTWESSPEAAIATQALQPPRDRVSITPRTIAAARKTIVLVAGAAKADAIRKSLDQRLAPSVWPSRLLRDSLWVVDSQAASLLP